MPAGLYAPGGIFIPLGHCVAFENCPVRQSFGGELRRTCPGVYGSERASLCYGKDTPRAFFSAKRASFCVQAWGQPAVRAASSSCCRFPCCSQLSYRYQRQVRAERHGFAICGHPGQTKHLAWGKQLLWSSGRDAGVLWYERSIVPKLSCATASSFTLKCLLCFRLSLVCQFVLPFEVQSLTLGGWFFLYFASFLLNSKTRLVMH